MITEFIRAHDTPNATVFEYSAQATSPSRAKQRARTEFVTSFPSHVTAITSISATKIGTSGIGLVEEYRVLIEVNADEDLRTRLGINDTARKFGEML